MTIQDALKHADGPLADDYEIMLASRVRELERENAQLRECGKALRDALAFECHKLGDCPREIDEWDALMRSPVAPSWDRIERFR
jgi:hypothetical protein